MLAPPERPAYLTTNAHAYVKAVFKQLKKTTTLDDLADAGMDQGTVYAYCVEAVLIVQALPKRLQQQRERSAAAVAAIPALNTVRVFVKALYSTDAVVHQPNEKAINRAIGYLENQARLYEKADPAAYKARRESRPDDEAAARWAAVRTAVGTLALGVWEATESPNDELVANLANDLFPGARPDRPGKRDPIIDKGIVRQCRRAVEPLKPEIEPYWG